MDLSLLSCIRLGRTIEVRSIITKLIAGPAIKSRILVKSSGARTTYVHEFTYVDTDSVILTVSIVIGGEQFLLPSMTSTTEYDLLISKNRKAIRYQMTDTSAEVTLMKNGRGVCVYGNKLFSCVTRHYACSGCTTACHTTIGSFIMQY